MPSSAEVAAAYERMMARTERRGECVIFTGPTTSAGYVNMRLGQGPTRRLMLGHRLAFLHRHGWLPVVVRHSCDTPTCLADEHHLPGTQADNVADMIARGRARRGHTPGEAHGMAKLTEADVRALRRERKKGATLRELAERYGVSIGQVGHIVNRRNWAHVA